jgi:hypothetical protein
MGINMVDVTLHINEETSHEERESLREALLIINGVMAAVCHDDKPHLLMIEYDPQIVTSNRFVEVASERGIHSQLISL